MKEFLLSIFCFFFPTSTSCTPAATVNDLDLSTPPAIVVQPTIAMTYSPIFTSGSLSAGPHTFSISLKSNRPSVGYQLMLSLSGNISDLTITQQDIAGLQNLSSQVNSNVVSLASIMSNPSTPFTPNTSREIAQISFTVNQPNTKVVFSQGAPFSKVTLYDKQTQDIVNLLENKSASVTIKQLNW